jgi:hypothetical protein
MAAADGVSKAAIVSALEADCFCLDKNVLLRQHFAYPLKQDNAIGMSGLLRALQLIECVAAPYMDF